MQDAKERRMTSEKPLIFPVDLESNQEETYQGDGQEKELVGDAEMEEANQSRRSQGSHSKNYIDGGRRSGRLLKNSVKYLEEKGSDEEESSDESDSESSGSEEEWEEERRHKRPMFVEGDEESDEVVDQPSASERDRHGDGMGAVDEAQQEDNKMEKTEGEEEMDQTEGGDGPQTSKDSEKQCPVDGCSKKLPSIEDLEKHMKLIHDKPYHCRVCKKACKELYMLLRHYRSHTGEKPFKCATCQKAFSQEGNLKMHRRIHTGEKPYSCQVCSFSCAQPGALKSHMRVHVEDKLHKCSFCGDCFTQKYHLVEHMAIHKTYECRECSFKTAYNSELRKHVKKRHKQISLASPFFWCPDSRLC